MGKWLVEKRHSRDGEWADMNRRFGSEADATDFVIEQARLCGRSHDGRTRDHRYEIRTTGHEGRMWAKYSFTREGWGDDDDETETRWLRVAPAPVEWAIWNLDVQMNPSRQHTFKSEVEAIAHLNLMARQPGREMIGPVLVEEYVDCWWVALA